jgi:hypothetical protein
MTGPAGVVATNGTGAFDFTNANGFVAPGTFGSGALGATGSGTRLLWYPRKAAFRAGGVLAQWDDANIGNYSIATGFGTTASAQSSTALGSSTIASAPFSTAMGGGTVAAGFFSTAMGQSTQATGEHSTAMGKFSLASGQYSIAAGLSNTASGGASVALGVGVTASGDNTTAMGVHASTNGHAGSFVYGDTSMAAIGTIVEATAPNQFVVRAAGGFRFRTAGDLSTGCDLPTGSGTWACTSSRSMKDRVSAVDVDELLVRLRTVPVNIWGYINEPGNVRHIGPFAEDFHAAFGLGVSDTAIGLQDIDGVNFAAIQALDARTRAQLDRDAAYQARIAELERQVAELRKAVEMLIGRQ